MCDIDNDNDKDNADRHTGYLCDIYTKKSETFPLKKEAKTSGSPHK